MHTKTISIDDSTEEGRATVDANAEVAQFKCEQQKLASEPHVGDIVA